MICSARLASIEDAALRSALSILGGRRVLCVRSLIGIRLRCLPRHRPQGLRSRKVIIETEHWRTTVVRCLRASARGEEPGCVKNPSASLRHSETRKRAPRSGIDFWGSGAAEIPVRAGKPTVPKALSRQQRYAEGGQFAKAAHGDAVDFLLEQIRRYPGEITLVAIGP